MLTVQTNFGESIILAANVVRVVGASVLVIARCSHEPAIAAVTSISHVNPIMLTGPCT